MPILYLNQRKGPEFSHITMRSVRGAPFIPFFLMLSFRSWMHLPLTVTPLRWHMPVMVSKLHEFWTPIAIYSVLGTMLGNWLVCIPYFMERKPRFQSPANPSSTQHTDSGTLGKDDGQFRAGLPPFLLSCVEGQHCRIFPIHLHDQTLVFKNIHSRISTSLLTASKGSSLPQRDSEFQLNR